MLRDVTRRAEEMAKKRMDSMDRKVSGVVEDASEAIEDVVEATEDAVRGGGLRRKRRRHRGGAANTSEISIQAEIKDAAADLKDAAKEVRAVAVESKDAMEADMQRLDKDVAKIAKVIMQINTTPEARLREFDRQLAVVKGRYEDCLRQMKARADKAALEGEDAKAIQDYIDKVRGDMQTIASEGIAYRADVREGVMTFSKGAKRAFWWLVALLPRTFYLTLIAVGTALMVLPFIGIVAGLSAAAFGAFDLYGEAALHSAAMLSSPVDLAIITAGLAAVGLGFRFLLKVPSGFRIKTIGELGWKSWSGYESKGGTRKRRRV
jgi:hypothetical protein